MTRFLRQIGSLLTRANNVFRHSGYAHMTTSARSFRDSWLADTEAERMEWSTRRGRIDANFPEEDDGPHCESTWNGRFARALQTIDDDERIRRARGMVARDHFRADRARRAGL